MTLALVVVFPIGMLGTLVLAETYPRSLDRGIIPGALLAVACLGWSLAYFVMIAHQEQSGYVSPDDIQDWERRHDAKLGVLVPFIYRLASPKQRQVLAYLGRNPRVV
jgi:hypothetical protein